MLSRPSDTFVRLKKKAFEVGESIDENNWIKKLANFLKFPLDMSDDILFAIKDVINIAEKILESLVGSVFSILCFYLALLAAKELYYDLKVEFYYQMYLEQKEHEKNLVDDELDLEMAHKHAERILRIKKNIPALILTLGATGLGLAILIAATTALTASGVVFYPFAIMVALSGYSALNLWESVTAYKKAQKRGASKEEMYDLRAKLIYDSVDFAASFIITAGVGLMAFGAFAAVNVAGMGIPLLIIIAAASVAIAFKLFEHRQAIAGLFLGLGKSILRTLSRGALCKKEENKAEHKDELKDRPKSLGAKIDANETKVASPDHDEKKSLQDEPQSVKVLSGVNPLQAELESLLEKQAESVVKEEELKKNQLEQKDLLDESKEELARIKDTLTTTTKEKNDLGQQFSQISTELNLLKVHVATTSHRADVAEAQIPQLQQQVAELLETQKQLQKANEALLHTQKSIMNETKDEQTSRPAQSNVIVMLPKDLESKADLESPPIEPLSPLSAVTPVRRITRSQSHRLFDTGYIDKAANGQQIRRSLSFTK